MSQSNTEDKITHDVSKILQALAGKIDDTLSYAAGERIPFTLVVFTPNRANYVSNVEKEKAVEALEELLDYWKSKDSEDIPAHEVH